MLQLSVDDGLRRVSVKISVTGANNRRVGKIRIENRIAPSFCLFCRLCRLRETSRRKQRDEKQTKNFSIKKFNHKISFTSARQFARRPNYFPTNRNRKASREMISGDF